MSKAANPLGHFHSSPELICMMVMLYRGFPLSLRNVENLLFERDLVDRQTYKARRSAAPAEWQSLIA